MWRCRSGGDGDRGSETGASRADQWFESSRWGEFCKKSKSLVSMEEHDIWRYASESGSELAWWSEYSQHLQRLWWHTTLHVIRCVWEIWHRSSAIHRGGRCFNTKREKAERAAEPGASKEVDLGVYWAFVQMELLPLGFSAVVPGDLPRCSARELRRSSCALPRAGCLFCCTGQISFASIVFFGTKSNGAERVARDLSQGQEVDVDFSCLEVFLFLFPPCLSVVAFVCLVVMTVMYGIHGFPWAAASLWLPVLLLLAFYIAFFKSEKFFNTYLDVFERIFGDENELKKEGGLNFRDHTIVFEGKILPGKPCVSSWPGKYESAWMRWCRKVVEGTSVPLWCFCRKAQDTLASMTRSQQLRTCQVLAGAHLCMAKKSHGGAGGGRTGSKTLRRLWRKVPSSKCTSLITWKVKGKLKAFPQLELNIWEENRFFAEKVTSKSPRSSKVQSDQGWKNCLWRNVEMARHNTHEKSTVCSLPGLMRRIGNSWFPPKA